MRRYLFGFVVITLSLQSAYANHATLPDGVTPVMATWLWGYYTVPESITKDGSPRLYSYPHTDAARINDPPWTVVAARHMVAGAKAPAILRMHGCSGISRGPIGDRVFLMSEGYAIFEPDSFARPGRQPCLGGNQLILHEEIGYALGKIRELSWVNHERIILMGVSEGGRAVAGWEKPGFAAHVILAMGCSGSSNLRPRAPDGVPVLAMVGGEDHRALSRCEVSSDIGGSKSIVIPGAPHSIMDRREVRDALELFLSKCC
jgi:dienelactone hydrolase